MMNDWKFSSRSLYSPGRKDVRRSRNHEMRIWTCRRVCLELCAVYAKIRKYLHVILISGRDQFGWCCDGVWSQTGPILVEERQWTKDPVKRERFELKIFQKELELRKSSELGGKVAIRWSALDALKTWAPSPLLNHKFVVGYCHEIQDSDAVDLSLQIQTDKKTERQSNREAANRPARRTRNMANRQIKNYTLISLIFTASDLQEKCNRVSARPFVAEKGVLRNEIRKKEWK